MTLRIASAGLIAVAFAVSAQTAQAAPKSDNVVCASFENVTERLGNAYGETLHSVGMTKSRFRIEVFVSEKRGTWTITARRGDGPSCLIASGEGFDGLSRQVAFLKS